MRTLIPSTQYKKDLKRYSNDMKKMESLLKVLQHLQNDELIPIQYSPHRLKGKYKDCVECHIENDFLLIWIDDDVVTLVRLGSYSELFK